VRTVEDLVNSIARDVLALEDATLRAIIPALVDARHELERDLRAWLADHSDGAERFTAQDLRRALASVDAALETISESRPQMESAMVAAARAGATMAVDHIRSELAMHATQFGASVRPTKLSSAAVMARAQHEIIPRIATSAARYVQTVREDMRHQFALGLVRGENFEQLTNRLRRLGGPRGLVALRGIAGDPGAQVEHIAEGLFARYRHWAERVVRTEVINAYNVEHVAGIEELNDELAADGQTALQQRWDSTPDFRRCSLCAALDGQVRAIGDEFAPGVLRPPRHPNCRCVVVAWDPSWDPHAVVGKQKAKGTKQRKQPRQPKPPKPTAPPSSKPPRAPKKPVSQAPPATPTPAAAPGDKNALAAIAKVAGGDLVGARRLIEQDLGARRLSPHFHTPGNDVVRVQRMKPGLRGSHAWSGEIALAKPVAGDASKFATAVNKSEKNAKAIRATLEESARRRDASIANPSIPFVRTARMQSLEKGAQGLRTLVHETTHGYGPLRAWEYSGAGVLVEEITTELVARRYLHDNFGYSRELGSYQDYINRAIDATKAALGLDRPAALDALDRASQTFRGDAMPTSGALSSNQLPPVSRLAKHIAAASPAKAPADNTPDRTLHFEDKSEATPHEWAIVTALRKHL